MLRNSPMNYLVSALVAALLWVLNGVIVGGYLAERVALQQMTTEDFLSAYRLVLAGVTVLALLVCYYWYFYGSRPDTIEEVNTRARRVWIGGFAGAAVIGVAGIVSLIVLMLAEAQSVVDVVIEAAALLVSSIVLYWVCSLLMSPSIVRFVPWGSK